MPPSGPEAEPGASAGAPSSAGEWRWALLLVASIHLLTTAGAWYVTDHAEYLFVARRLLDHGTFELAPAGVRRVEMLPWLVPGRGDTLRTRLLPGTPLTLVPLLAVDRALGLESPQQFGRIVHLQGHLFALAGLYLLGRAVRRLGNSDAAAAVAVVLTGICWPVWFVARRIGPEPILLLLVCLCLGAGGSRRSADRTRGVVCLLLPWVSPTGPVIGLAVAAAAIVEAWLACGRRLSAEVGRGLLWPVGGLAAGVATLLLWNQLHHGDWWLGGYAPYYAGHPPFATDRVLAGAALHLRSLLLEGPAILALAGLGLRKGRGRSTSGLSLAALLTVALVVMFAGFHQPEPSRRMAVVWPCWALVVGCTWDRLRLRGAAAQALLAAAFIVGFYWLVRIEGRHYLGPGGLYYPNVLWVGLLVTGAPGWQLIPAGVLSGLLAAAAARTGRLLRHPPPEAPGLLRGPLTP